MPNVCRESIFAVKEQWAKVTAVPNYEETAGSILFQNLFIFCPEAQVLFGFPLDTYPDPALLLDSRRFKMHASFLMEMIDQTIMILGEDDDKLKATCADIGKKHWTYGVKPEFFPFMTDAILAMLEKFLDEEELTDSHKGAWRQVFGALIADIEEAQTQLAYEEASKNKTNVIAIWEKLGAIPNYKKIAGGHLFQILFRKCPEAKPLFGFPEELDVNSSYVTKSSRFRRHAVFMIEMVDKMINMLGVDNEGLSQTLQKLGKMHGSYGVKAEYLPFMTEALVEMLTYMLGDAFTKADKKAWGKVFSAVIVDMTKGQRLLDKGLAAGNKTAVVKSWRMLAVTPNYQEKAGVVLFGHLFRELPEAKALFGFPATLQYEDMAKSRRFASHAAFLIEMIEKALNMLGENDKELTKMMYELGETHAKYGVKYEYLPYMTDALIKTLQQSLGVQFSTEDEHAWKEVMNSLIGDMTKAQRALAMKAAMKSFSATESVHSASSTESFSTMGGSMQ